MKKMKAMKAPVAKSAMKAMKAPAPSKATKSLPDLDSGEEETAPDPHDDEAHT